MAEGRDGHLRAAVNVRGVAGRTFLGEAVRESERIDLIGVRVVEGVVDGASGTVAGVRRWGGVVAEAVVAGTNDQE